MDVDSARRNLQHHYKDSTTPEMLMSDKNFYTDMVNDFKVSSRLVIKMYRHASAKSMADSLKDKIEPPAKRRYEVKKSTVWKKETLKNKKIKTMQWTERITYFNFIWIIENKTKQTFLQTGRRPHLEHDVRRH